MFKTTCLTADLGKAEEAVLSTLARLDKEGLPRRIWKKDASLWKQDPAEQEKINNRLGWLSIVPEMIEQVAGFKAFADEVRSDGVSTVVLLGMGGSSLCPDVLRQSFPRSEGAPRLCVLDTTDPESILSVEKTLDWTKTLFLVASKSGGTIEPMSLYRYFEARLQTEGISETGRHFVAITDPASPLAELAEKQGFRKCFFAPSDVGGRYSALTVFGLVPAALIGIDLEEWLSQAETMMIACAAETPIAKNEGIVLGVIMATLAKSGRDKLTFVAEGALSHFGIWAEQLIAESTGKEGQGVVPIDGETLAAPEAYGQDRFFVSLELLSSSCDETNQKLNRLAEAGHPVVRISLPSVDALSGEFFRWELATAVAGLILGINPFDEPNVSESKANTADVLERYQSTGELDLLPSVAVEEGIVIAGDLSEADSKSLKTIWPAFFSRARPEQYIAIMVYFAATEAHQKLLSDLRNALRNKYHLATTLGFGPRFLHSTGQLHKGGGRKGHFIQLTADDIEPLAIPGGPYSFSILKQAQALGDLHSLMRHRLSVLEVRLGASPEKGLLRLIETLQ